MAWLSFGFFFVAAVLLIFSKLVSSLIARSRLNIEASRQGCEPPYALPNKDIFGLTRLLGLLKATREERGPQYLLDTINAEAGEDVHTLHIHVFPRAQTLMTRDPENVKAIFVTHASSFEINAHRSGVFRPLLGDGIFTSRSEAWRHSRALLRPQFSREQLSDLTLEQRHVDTLLSALPIGPDGWTETVDLQPHFFRMTLEAMTEFLYGHSPSQLDADPSAPSTAVFGYHMDAGKTYINTRLALGKYHWLIHPRSFTNHCNQVHAYVDYFIQQKFQHRWWKQSPANLANEKPKKFILLDELAKQTSNAEVLRSETLNVLSAGRDTTASLLSFLFYFLARNPATFSRLRSTILSTFGLNAHDITFPQLKNCTYLHHCINETLRLTAILPIMERVSLEDTTLPRGGGKDGQKPIFIPKGQSVLISTYALQQRKDIWGPDVDVFRPERWENRRPGMEFVPFGGGPRKCIGRTSKPLCFIPTFCVLPAPHNDYVMLI